MQIAEYSIDDFSSANSESNITEASAKVQGDLEYIYRREASQAGRPPTKYLELPHHAIHHVRPTIPHLYELEDASWDLGAPLGDVKRLAAYWKDEFDWRAIEARLNSTLPQFTTRLKPADFEPVDFHFIHHKSDVPGAIPLLFVHGWPGSFLEVSALLPLLTASSDAGSVAPAFHIVAPSLVNFGFSSGVSSRGFGLAQHAEMLDSLMRRLGYSQYVTQGGDWGMMITRTMGLLYPSRVKASHINMIRANPPAWDQPLLKVREMLGGHSDADRAGFQRTQWFDTEGSAYRALQATKPQTLGYALNDSPVALLAWIWEKLHDWTDAYPWTHDEILTWVAIYWFSAAGPAASLRLYYESRHEPAPAEEVERRGRTMFVNRDRTHTWIPHVKLGVARFPRELTVLPPRWAETLGPLVYASDNEHGGHFAATEHPEAIARDLRAMFGKGGGAYGCVEGRDGYLEKAKL